MSEELEKPYDPTFDKIFSEGSTEVQRVICKAYLYLSFSGYGAVSENLLECLVPESDKREWCTKMLEKINELQDGKIIDFWNMDFYEMKTNHECGVENSYDY
jgi:hypothetical protein